MCGIVGGFWRDGSAIADRLSAALEQLRRRGPDDRGADVEQLPSGTLALGHARLSIIDLSSGGHQPMLSPDGSFAMVFNGEIYNYRELRQQLEALGVSFRTQSDSEVLLAAWIHWGPDCLRRLDGIHHHRGTLVTVPEPRRSVRRRRPKVRACRPAPGWCEAGAFRLR